MGNTTNDLRDIKSHLTIGSEPSSDKQPECDINEVGPPRYDFDLWADIESLRRGDISITEAKKLLKVRTQQVRELRQWMRAKSQSALRNKRKKK